MHGAYSRYMTVQKRAVRALLAFIAVFMVVVPTAFITHAAEAAADENVGAGRTVQVLYDFYNSSTGDMKDVTDIVRFDAPQETDGSTIYVKVCDYPGQYGEAEEFLVMVDFAAVADAAAGVMQTDITSECAFDAETGFVAIPTAYAAEDLSIIFFVPDNKSGGSSLQVLSADNPQIGERFAIFDANIQACESYNQNAHHCFGMDDHYPHYGFAVSIFSCANRDVEQAGVPGNGGIIYGSTGDPYDYNWAASYNWVWADCAEAGVSNTGGECSFNDGYVEVRSVDSASNTVSYYFFMNVDGENGDPFQNVAGYFTAQIPGGYAQVQKSSADPSVTSDNPCYSLGGATYTVYNASGTSVAELVTAADGLTNKSGALPLGSYTCKETAAPAGFVLDSTVYSLNISADAWDTSRTVTLTTTPELFKTGTDPDSLTVTVNKADAETATQAAQGAATLEGTELVLKHYPISPDAVMSIADLEGTEPDRTWTLVTDENGKASVLPWTSDGGKPVSGIPLGVCTLEETKAPQGYLINPELQLFTVTDAGTLQHFSLTNVPRSSDDVIRGDLELTKVSADTQERLKGVPFRITSKTTGESHTIVTDANGYASTAASWNLHTSDTNGGADTSGIWFGEETPDDSRGALIYDSYLIEEQPCDANDGKELIPAFEVEVSRDGQCIDLGTLENKDLPKAETLVPSAAAPTKAGAVPKTGDGLAACAAFGSLALLAVVALLASRKFKRS